MNPAFFTNYHINLYDEILLFDNYYKFMNNKNTKYNKNILLKHNLPNEIIILIFSHLPLSSLLSCYLSCNIFLLCVQIVAKFGNIFVTKYSEFKTILESKGNFMKLICENINVIKYDNGKNYDINYGNILYGQNDILNNLPKLKKIIIYANFVDQIQFLKSFNCRNYDIIIITCNNNSKCYACLTSEIYQEMMTICRRFKLYHKGILYKDY